jgi:2-hydroxy-6-oxonona-2,4-dienedioate hydrolase
MAILTENTVNINGGAMHYRRGGLAGAPATVFLHGGIPGVSPFCGGSHLWGEVLDLFVDTDVIAIDMPGAAGSLMASTEPGIDSFAAAVLQCLDKLGVDAFHIVGHDFGAAVALSLAMSVPGRLRSLVVAASGPSAPSTGEELPVLRAAPEPLWSAHSQRWSFERLSYSHSHISADLLDASCGAGSGEAHQHALRWLREKPRWHVDTVARNRARLWVVCRESGLEVPTLVLWASQDPLSSVEAGYLLFKTIAERQRTAHFALLNRAGTFAFREQPAQFHHLVSSFQRGVTVARR